MDKDFKAIVGPFNDITKFVFEEGMPADRVSYDKIVHAKGKSYMVTMTIYEIKD